MDRRHLTLATLVAVAACGQEEAGLRPVPTVQDSALDAAALQASDSSGLVCDQANPVEGEGGTSQLLCHRVEEADTDDEGVICWYLVTYGWVNGKRVKLKEDFLYCEPAGGGEGDDCDETQTEVFEEYDSSQPHGGHGQSPQQPPPDCETIEHHASVHAMATNFTWGELNGGFADGNPHRGAGGGWGWIQSSLPSGLQTLRNAWAADSLGKVYGAPLPVSSGYRCPHGNASIPLAVNDSWHMSGVAADISVRRIARRHPKWATFDAAKRDAKYKEVWEWLDNETNDGTNKNRVSTKYDYYTDRHFHIAF